MKYSKIIHGKFIERPNRFIAHVEVDGKIETVHVKNTGRCKELLLPEVEVVLEDFRENPGTRKTLFDLIAVYKIYPEHPEKKPVLINMDSQAPNKVVLEYLTKQKSYSLIHSEHTYGNSRVDFYLEKKLPDNSVQKILMEVKGCTLEVNGTGYFPDAPTERGVKHLKELTTASRQGYECFLAFVIQIPGVERVFPNIQTHPEFWAALTEAIKSGVKIIYYCCEILDNEMNIIKEISNIIPANLLANSVSTLSWDQRPDDR